MVTIRASISDGMSRDAGGTTEITAGTYSDAVAEAEQWVRDGDYSSAEDAPGYTPGDEIPVQLVISAAGEIVERRTVMVTP